jgi:hypothetical protein
MRPFVVIVRIFGELARDLLNLGLPISITPSSSSDWRAGARGLREHLSQVCHLSSWFHYRCGPMTPLSRIKLSFSNPAQRSRAFLA